tara:strand:- start:102057 stop:102863 length:807 start_codon:yes stop_codon:yes gene_type:complete
MIKKCTLILLLSITAQRSLANCGEAYSQATYALNHTKKSLEANNYDHQMYYADRAIEALEKTRSMTETCGCDTTMDYILNGLGDLKKSADPEDWEEGRYFAKKALAEIHSLINAYDICTSKSTINYTSDTTPEGAADLSQAGEDLKLQQQNLEIAQQKLLEQQREIEEKIEKQRLLAAQLQRNRELELEEQMKLKRFAENSLRELEMSLKELATVFGCADSGSLKPLTFKSESSLNAENLETTRKYYAEQAISLQNGYLELMKKCSGN